MLIDSLLLIGLIMTNGALALSEIAIVSSRRTRLVEMIDKGSSGAARAMDLASEPTRLLSSVQIGMTSIGILSGAIGEATIAGHVRQVLEPVPALAAYAESLSLVVVVVIITYVSVILGELVPKRLAMTDPERTAAIVAGPMQVLAKIGRPIVFVLSGSTSTVLSLLRVPKVKRAGRHRGRDQPAHLRAHARWCRFVDEDDRRRDLPRLRKELTHAAGSNTNDHLDEFRGARAERVPSPRPRSRVQARSFQSLERRPVAYPWALGLLDGDTSQGPLRIEQPR